MKTGQLYAQVTEHVIAQLEAGIVPWVRPWRFQKTFGIMPQNAATGRPYTGINILILWAARDAFGYASNGWMTFRQAHAKGGTVRKGEKGTPIVFMKPLRIKEPEADEEKTIRMLRSYYVFNTEQIDGLPTAEPQIIPPQPEGRVSDFIKAIGATVQHGGNRACYVPSLDFISLPHPHQFESVGSYYATSLHEHAHWSGAKDRLNRDLSGRFGTQSYAAEELVAELTAAFLCAHLDIEGELRHADYIGHWLQLLKSDERAIFTAAAKASQAATYLRAQAGETEEGESDGESPDAGEPEPARADQAA